MIDKLYDAYPLLGLIFGFATLFGALVKYGIIDLKVKDEGGVDVVSQIETQVKSSASEVSHHAEEIEKLKEARIDHHGRIAALEAIQSERRPK